MIDLYIFDLDGTLYRGQEAVPHSVEVVRALRTRGKQIRFLTNNSGLEPSRIAKKLGDLGFEAAIEEVYSTAMGAVWKLRELGARSVYVVGEPGLRATLENGGFQLVTDESGACDVVLAGICRSLTYAQINTALQFIRNGARFVATNRDATYPLEGGRFEPGAGATVAAIEACTGVEPLVIGKPEPYLVERILEDAGLKADQALVVGDRYETDIVAGERAGCQTLLVLTGATMDAPEGVPSALDLRALLD
ncbi:MAG: HAD-IIA family hydrolase [Fimbriimonadaceae bacterium]|nr:HAD-IIA family hydrolase [Fimbriimonadaceae bacterium]